MMRTAIPAEEIFKKTRSVGQYYGFSPFATLAAEERGSAEALAAREKPRPDEPAPSDPRAATMAAFLLQARATGILAREGRGPLFLWHSNLAPGRMAPKKVVIQFHAIGSDRALAEAVVIRALSALVADLYHAEPAIRLNSMGDRETRARYLRELATFFKRRASILPPECAAAAAKDVLAGAELVAAEHLADLLPLSTEYLSDASRKRFEELLEHLEATNTPYELARDLMTDGAHWNDACFELRAGERRVAWGSRYHELARRVLGQAMPAVGALLEVESAAGAGAPLAATSPAKTRFAFIHIGDEAKRLSLQLAGDFHRAHVPLSQDIGVESLIEQMRYVEKKNPAYLLVMGRKEALEGCVILRDRATQEERVLP
ncbi:MAG: hypothetical protein KGI78_02735, partial [Patescibacteria group bacterium]|nr:hypothetical protein [Patescibacteria group bacterium]